MTPAESLSNNSPEHTSTRHWTHLLAFLLNRTPAKDETSLDEELEVPDWASRRPLPPEFVADPAEDAHFISDTIAAFGPGPVPARHGLQGRRLQVPPVDLLLLLKICRLFGTYHRWEAAVAHGALTIFEGRVKLADLARTLKNYVFHEWCVLQETTSRDLRRLHIGSMSNVGTDSPRRSTVAVRKFFEDPSPMILVRPADAPLPPQAALYSPAILVLGHIDQELLLAILAVHYPELSDKALAGLAEQFEDLDLDNFDEQGILALFRLPSADEVIAALKRFAISEKPPGIALRDLLGLDEARDISLQILRDLELWQRGDLPWQDVIRGLLLVGPPGTGKTFLAQALAREGKLTFVSGSYAKWQKRGNLSHFLQAMAEDFGRAIEGRPSLLFIDELDAFYTRRELTGGKNDSYDVKAITGFLEHLDGFAGREGVVLLAASNRLDLIDEAITRAGRFDRIINVPLPDRAALQGIIRQHLGQVLTDCDLPGLAGMALGRSGADVAAAIRVARAEARSGRRPMTESDIATALIGGATKQLSPEMRRTIAFHEAAHAIVAQATGFGRPSSVALTRSGGEVRSQREPELETAVTLHRDRTVGLAGRAAEILVFGSASGGSGGSPDSDLGKANFSAMRQELSLGLGASGPIWTPSDPARTDFLSLPLTVRERIQSHVQRAEDEATLILERNRCVLEHMATALIERHFLSGRQLDVFLDRVVVHAEGSHENLQERPALHEKFSD